MFTREEISEIKKRIDIAELAGRYTELKPRGRDLWGCCPFHEEKTPSFKVDPEKGTWHCFGCGEGGDVVDFALKKNLNTYALLIGPNPSAFIREHGVAAVHVIMTEHHQCPMTIDLVDDSPEMADSWRLAFSGCPDVNVFECGFSEYIARHPDTDGIVTPGNSYGLMDGGYDKAVTDEFGWELPEAVQACILERFYGEQPVATSISIPVPGRENLLLIHTPTMYYPARIADPLVVYQCMRTSLMEALRTSRKRVAIPAFGGGCGFVPPMRIAQLMREGYDQLNAPPTQLTWEYADSRRLEERYRT